MRWRSARTRFIDELQYWHSHFAIFPVWCADIERYVVFEFVWRQAKTFYESDGEGCDFFIWEYAKNAP